VTGESYAGHYVPNIAWEVAVNASEIPLQGVVIGNGMYNMKKQYPTVGPIAHAAGVIDAPTLTELEKRQAACVAKIDAEPATAGAYCENVTVYWLYSDAGAGELDLT
jgi:carboxypeptidase C (cathepsin A)